MSVNAQGLGYLVAHLDHSSAVTYSYSTMTTEIATALIALEQLSSSSATSSSGPLNALLDSHFAQAKERILAGDNPKAVITDLQKDVIKAKKGVEKGLKAWYTGLGNVGKAIDSVGCATSHVQV